MSGSLDGFLTEGKVVRNEDHESRPGTAPRTEAGVFIEFEEVEEEIMWFSDAEAHIAITKISIYGLKWNLRLIPKLRCSCAAIIQTEKKKQGLVPILQSSKFRYNSR